MSTLGLNALTSNGTVNANTVTFDGGLGGGNAATINSTSFAYGNVVVNSTVIVVGNSTQNTVLQGTPNVSTLIINGTSYTSLITAHSEWCNVQTFTATGPGTWTAPAWTVAQSSPNTSSDIVLVHMWGAGGGGAANSGGGGGTFVYGIYLKSMLGSTVSFHIGQGGATGVAGGNSMFNGNSTVNSSSTFYAYGGGGANTTRGGGGGGWFGPGLIANGGFPESGAYVSYGGGQGGSSGTPAGGISLFGGGGGAYGSGAGGGSTNGGAGGAGNSSSTAGISLYGGSGGNSTVVATQPGGGGAGNTNFTGANGKIIVYTLRKIL